MKNLSLIISLFFLTAFVNAQELQSLIEEAIQNNPEVRSFDIKYAIAEEKIKEANWLPNTEFSLGYFVSETETRVGAQRARIGVKQMLPWFGTLSARENYASSMAEAEYIEVTIAKRKLGLSVAQSYYNLYESSTKQLILEENIQLLKTYERLALTSVETGKASAVDVLRLQIRQNELKQQKEILSEIFEAEKVAFNNLLNRDINFEISSVVHLELPEENEVFDIDVLSLNPELLKYNKLYESIVQSEMVNKRESLPTIGIGLDYLPVSERADMVIADNGKDVIMPMVSVSIPLFNSKYTSISKQNELRQKEIEFQKNQRYNILNTTFSKALSQRNQAQIKYRTQSKNLKQARDAEDILIKNYETGTIDFNDLLDIQELQLKFQLNQIESIRSFYTQQSILNYLIQ
ncbi:TolC family protein [Maribacter sp. BPC-D8]|uniref:TolC family protein n=1 Tax=Maribacter sp. BPC-D8 TaxID=3053613 RepID=UPI002B47233D|nr:TolC family protein [Maribacter sp. BPC-D8]WRI28361.1 TolC family protein [Maribacter sp. BPC-D8]